MGFLTKNKNFSIILSNIRVRNRWNKIVGKIALLFLLLLLGAGYAQKIDLNQSLKGLADKTFIKGVLPNGMTYYIKKTDVVKNTASYYIVQNVGSILEDENQRGLAHFLEHMAFNGTKNFPGKGILNTLQKQGAIFGRDINAYTSFDQTVYNLNNISTKGNLIDTCLLVLHDWSNYLSLTDKEIDAERGVIKEEWRSRQNGRNRLYKKAAPTLYNHSKYAKRLPIGLMSIVENFKYKALRDFYHNWYRTDLQAIVIIGDVDVAKIKQKINNMFSEIPAIKNPRKRFVVTIPDNDKLSYHIGTDPEVASSNIQFDIRYKKPPTTGRTVADLKKDLLESMAMTMLNNRISEKNQDTKAPFLSAYVGDEGLSRTSNIFSISISPKQGKQQAAFRAILTEVMRAVKFGYTSSEIKRAIKELLNYYQTRISQQADRSQEALANLVISNYLEGITIVDIKKEFPIAKQIFATVKPEEIRQTIRRLYAKKNRVIDVTGVQGKNNLTKTQALQIINSVANDSKLTPYIDAVSGKTLLSGIKIKEGKIIKTEQNTLLNSTTFTLSNGIKVHYKFDNKDKNNIELRALSYGGESLLDPKDLPSANVATALAENSGIGDYSIIELSKVLTGKTASVSLGLSSIGENLRGYSTTKDVATMLQLVYLYFEKPRFDKQSFQLLKQQLNDQLLQRSKSIQAKVGNKITEIMYGRNNPRVRLFDQKYIDEISFDKIKAIYEKRFADPADFDFYIVGDIKITKLKPLLSKYIASLPTTAEREIFKDKTPHWLSNTIDKVVYLKMKTPKAYVNFSFKKSVPYSLKNKLLASMIGELLSLRLTETLREEQGGVYSPSAYASLRKRPTSRISLGTYFVCNPDLADKLAKITYDEWVKITQGIINQKDLEKTKKSFLEDRKKSKNSNNYSMSLLTNFYREGYNMNDPKTFENIIKNISKRDIQRLAKDVLKNGKYSKIIIKPKK